MDYSFKKSDFDFNTNTDQILIFKDETLNKCSELLNNWESPTYLEGFSNKRTVYKMNELAHSLIVRNIITILKKVFKISLSSRDTIIRELTPLLSNPSPYQVIRLDISSFYQSIPHKDLLKKIESNSKVSAKTTNLISKYLASMKSRTGNDGLMQGHPLSAILSEVCLVEFDHAIQTMSDVVLYHRFVDDIIIVCCKNDFKKKEFKSEIEKKLPFSSLQLNSEKEKIINFNKLSTTGNFNFLGYTFEIKDRQLNIKVDLKKIKKIKKKIFFSIKHFNKKSLGSKPKHVIEKELHFFINSMKCLASSSLMKKRKISLPVGNRLNYKFSTCDGKSFAEIDKYLQSIPYIKSNKDVLLFNAILTKHDLHEEMKSIIKRVSFESFYRYGIYIQFPRERSKEFWEIWKYV